MDAYRTLTYRGICVQKRVTAEGRAEFQIHNWALRKFSSWRDVCTQINKILKG